MRLKLFLCVVVCLVVYVALGLLARALGWWALGAFVVVFVSILIVEKLDELARRQPLGVVLLEENENGFAPLDWLVPSEFKSTPPPRLDTTYSSVIKRRTTYSFSRRRP